MDQAWLGWLARSRLPSVLAVAPTREPYLAFSSTPCPPSRQSLVVRTGGCLLWVVDGPLPLMPLRPGDLRRTVAKAVHVDGLNKSNSSIMLGRASNYKSVVCLPTFTAAALVRDTLFALRDLLELAV